MMGEKDKNEERGVSEKDENEQWEKKKRGRRRRQKIE